MDEPTDYERMGGEPVLRRVVDRFVDRFFADFIIGFLFEGKDRARIKIHEAALAAAHLGGPKAYAGRPLGEAHLPLKINKGHFRRRLAILRQVLAEEGVPADVIGHWIATEQALEPVITTNLDCVE